MGFNVLLHNNFKLSEAIENLKSLPEAKEIAGNYLFSLATSPEYFGPAAVNLKAAGLADSQVLAAELAVELAEHARHVALQERERRELAAAGQPRYELPAIADGIDLGGLYRLAEVLRERGAA